MIVISLNFNTLEICFYQKTKNVILLFIFISVSYFTCYLCKIIKGEKKKLSFIQFMKLFISNKLENRIENKIAYKAMDVKMILKM